MNRERIVKVAFLSLFANLAFSFYTGVLGISNRSWWLITLAAYYVVLSVMRFAVLLSHKKGKGDSVSERFIMRFTGVSFMAMAVILAGTTYLVFSDDQSLRQHEIVMITFAVYAFSKVTIGIINLVKSRKISVPTLKVLRNISFADALVSIFTLQRSMLVSFEGMSAGDISLFNALTGSAVYIAVFLLGLNLLGGDRVNMAKGKIVEANKKVAKTVTGSYKKVEKGVVGGYKKIEGGAVTGYTKLEDKFIDRFLTHDGESVQEARERLKKERSNQ